MPRSRTYSSSSGSSSLSDRRRSYDSRRRYSSESENSSSDSSRRYRSSRPKSSGVGSRKSEKRDDRDYEERNVGKRSSRSKRWNMRELPTEKERGDTGEAKALIDKNALQNSSDESSAAETQAPAPTRSSNNWEKNAVKQGVYPSDDNKTKSAKPTPTATTKPSKPSHMCAWIAFVLFVILAVAGGVGIWYWQTHKDSLPSTVPGSTDQTSSASESAPMSSGNSSSPTSAGTSSSAISGLQSLGLNSSSESSSSSSSSSKGAAAAPSSANGSGSTSGATMTGHTTSGSATQGETASTTTASAPTGTSLPSTPTTKVEAAVTWFQATNTVGPCGTNPDDGKYVVHVGPDLWGDTSKKSELCGKWITAYNPDTKYYVNSTIQGYCEKCEKYALDASRATFNGFGEDMDIGTLKIMWWYMAPSADGKYPADGLTTAKTAPAASATISTKGNEDRLKVRRRW